jgi:sugar/nucleoside kinase (ribokinase family)
MTEYDVYAYGMISSSTLHILAPEFSFPAPDGYGEINETLQMIGGEAANSSIVLGKLGSRVKIDGNWLGDDEKGAAVMDILEEYGITTSRLTKKAGYRGVNEIVFSDKKTRTVFGTYCHLLFTEKQWNTPVKEDIRGAEIVCLDPFFKEESLLAARYASEFSVPYVTVDVKPNDPVAHDAAVLIISGEFRRREYPDREISSLLADYTNKTEGIVIFTSGESDILYQQKGKGEGRIQPFHVVPVDTTGAGDSFRAGIIYSMLTGWDMEESICFASGLAALVCTSFPGVLGAPDEKGVIDFIQKSGRDFTGR